MAASKIAVNLSGTVAYADGSIGSFGVWYDSANKAELVGSAAAFRAVHNSLASLINSFKSALSPATVTWTNPTVTDEVDAMTLRFSGVVAFDDNTSMVFSYEIRDNGVVYNHITTENGFNEAAKTTAIKNILKEVLETALNTLYPTVSTAVSITAA